MRNIVLEVDVLPVQQCVKRCEQCIITISARASEGLSKPRFLCRSAGFSVCSICLLHTYVLTSHKYAKKTGAPKEEIPEKLHHLVPRSPSREPAFMGQASGPLSLAEGPCAPHLSTVSKREGYRGRPSTDHSVDDSFNVSDVP